MTLPRTTAALFVAALLVAGPACAHPKLLSSSPKADSASTGTDHVSLTFSEPLIPALSKISVTTAGKSVAVTKQDLSKDGKTLTAMLGKTLAAGAYHAAWTVVSTDTHKVAGKMDFTIK